MKTKKWILSLLFAGFSGTILLAQHKAALKCYGLMGTQLNSQGHSFYSGLNTNIYAFSAGMGIEYSTKHLFAGTEFYSASGEAANSSFKLDYNGFSSIMHAGINLFPSSRLALSPYAGIGMMLNKNTISRKDQTFSETLSKNQLSGVFAIKCEYSLPYGIFVGIRTGYNHGFFTNNNWLNEVSQTNSNFKNPANAFFLNASFGISLNVPHKADIKTNP